MKKNRLSASKKYWLKKIQIELYNELHDYMEANNLKQDDLAQKLGVSKGYISQLLNGNFDHKISKLVDLAFLMDKVPVINYPQYVNYVQKEGIGVMLPYKVFEYYTLKSPNQLKDESNQIKAKFHVDFKWFSPEEKQSIGILTSALSDYTTVNQNKAVPQVVTRLRYNSDLLSKSTTEEYAD